MKRDHSGFLALYWLHYFLFKLDLCKEEDIEGQTVNSYDSYVERIKR
jgi:hypothetical protein